MAKKYIEAEELKTFMYTGLTGNDLYKPNGIDEFVDGLPAADVAPRWIPVSERLPEEDGDYLVVYEKGYAEDYGFDRIGIAPYETDCAEYGGFGIWQERFDHYTLGSLGSDWVEIKVVAWMPLPEPWKGEAE